MCNKIRLSVASLLFLLALVLASCRKTQPYVLPEEFYNQKGFYLLNQGNMGSNKASLDFYDYYKGIYNSNTFVRANPDVGFKLGDVGNDLQIYGGRMYAVINCSNMVEVIDKHTVKHIGRFTVPNCRYIVFDSGKAYVSSYAGPVDPSQSQLGYVVEVDTATLKETRRVTVGYQPEQMQIVEGKLYVANSGGYNAPNYEKTVSVVDLASFTEIKKIEVGINLNLIQKDRKGNLYISSRGNYKDISSNIYRLDTRTEQVTSLGITSSSFVILGDSLFAVALEYPKKKTTYILYDLEKNVVLSNRFVSSEIATSIKVPYHIAFDERRQSLYICDAKDYTSPGELLCFDLYGNLLWRQTTGDIPAAIAFVR
jgi:lipoprotein